MRRHIAFYTDILKIPCRQYSRIWRACDFIGVLIQICTPKAKRAFGEDVMVTFGHQLHVAKAVSALIPVDKSHIILVMVESKDFFIFFAPFNTFFISKEIEYRVVSMLFDIVNSTLKETIFITIAIYEEHIASARVYRNGVYVSDFI